MKRKLTLLLTCLLASISLTIAQTSKKVTGVVFSEEDNQPVIGASVVIKVHLSERPLTLMESS